MRYQRFPSRKVAFFVLARKASSTLSSRRSLPRKFLVRGLPSEVSGPAAEKGRLLVETGLIRFHRQGILPDLGLQELEMSARKPHVIVVSGLSGSGKSTAIKAFEDIDYFCIDNLPVPLLGSFF